MPKEELEEDEIEEISEEEEEEVKTEEEAEDLGINLQDLEFQQFIQPLETDSSPVLEKIAGAQTRPIFVGGVAQGPPTAPGEEKESDEFKYVAGQEATDEPKYAASERMTTTSERVDPTKVRMETQPGPQVNQQPFFNQFSEQAQFQSQMVERFERAGRIDTQAAGRKDPLEKEDKKYKPDLPKP